MRLSNSEHLHALRTIQRNAHFLVDILNDVLDLSKRSKLASQVEPAAASLAGVVNEVVELAGASRRRKAELVCRPSSLLRFPR